VWFRRSAAVAPDAVGAGAEDLDDVLDVDEAVLLGDAACPALDHGTVDLHGPAAAAAGEVVVVPVSPRSRSRACRSWALTKTSQPRRPGLGGGACRRGSQLSVRNEFSR
jgi:hypothetical protein